jgi:hypothetical protein
VPVVSWITLIVFVKGSLRKVHEHEEHAAKNTRRVIYLHSGFKVVIYHECGILEIRIELPAPSKSLNPSTFPDSS